MRVLQLGKYYHPYKGGIESQLQLLCHELKDRVDLDVLVCNSRRASQVEYLDGVRITRCFELAKFASTSICPSMPLELARRRYDLVHFHFPHPMGVLSYLLQPPREPHRVVITYHSDIVKQKRLLRAYSPLLHRILDLADAIICTSENYIDGSEVLDRYRAKCRVIPCGVDFARFERTTRTDGQAAAIRARFKNRPLVLGVGRLVYYKGFEYLIRAMSSVDAELVLIGTGPLREALERLARDCGVGERVHFLGDVDGDSLAAHYYASDVYALPSIERSEAFAIVQLEAMACGLPVVNTAIPGSGVPTVSRHGESGLTVAPKDAAALSGALTTILANPEMAARFAVGGRARARKEFSSELVGAQTYALYQKAMIDGSSSTQR